MNFNLNVQEAEVAIPLETSALKKRIRRNILFHAFIIALLVLYFAIKTLSYHGVLKANIKSINFVFLEGIPLLLLVATPYMIMINSLGKTRRTRRSIYYENGIQFPWQEEEKCHHRPCIDSEWLFFDKHDLDADALSTILPTIYSIYHRSSLVKRLLVFLLFFIILLPLLSLLSSTNSTLYVISLFLYSLMGLRYLRRLQQLSHCTILISDETLTLPILGFFKRSYRKIPFEEIKRIEIVELINHKKNINIQSYGEFLEDLDTCWMEGIIICHKKYKVTLSTATVSFDFLYLLSQLLKKHNIKTSKRTLHE